MVDSELRLSIPTDQGLWCADTHAKPLRVSGVQSGVFSGPVGSTTGQQPFAADQVVREEQPAWWGWTPEHGRIEVRARMELSHTSMASVWMVGLEDSPERCGEICLFEVFGNTISADGRPPRSGAACIRFATRRSSRSSPPIRRTSTCAQPHTYAVEWRPDGVDFLLDGRVVRSSQQAPRYPMQMMIAVFDFPEAGSEPTHVPVLAVDEVRGEPLS